MNAHQPTPFYVPLERRRFLKAFARASAGFSVPGYPAEARDGRHAAVTQESYHPWARTTPFGDDNDSFHPNGGSTAALIRRPALSGGEKGRCVASFRAAKG